MKDALTTMQDIVGDSADLAGGTDGALQTDMPASVAKVFNDSPEAAMVVIGDFAPGVVTDNPLEPVTGYNVFTFPSINGSGPVVVGGGDLCVNFKTSEAATAFLDYLTTPDAAEIWAARGGFSSPNKNVDESVLPGRHHAGERNRARQCGGVPVRHVRPAAVRVRRDAGSRPVQGVHGLRGEARRRRRDHAADGDGREEGVQQLGVRALL